MRLLLLLTWVFLLAATCGQKGPLYLPPEPPEDGESGRSVDIEPPGKGSARARPAQWVIEMARQSGARSIEESANRDV